MRNPRSTRHIVTFAAKRGTAMACLSITALCAMALGVPASAKTCAETSIEARGETAKFVWLAKTKARANWRRRVRALPDLGPDYGNWNLAETTEERCITGPDGTSCVFTGSPCKP